MKSYRLWTICGNAEINLSAEGKTCEICRITVPVRVRRQGYGSELLLNTCQAADKEGVTLWLGINPYGGLDGLGLWAWFTGYGFIRSRPGVYIRLPK